VTFMIGLYYTPIVSNGLLYINIGLILSMQLNEFSESFLSGDGLSAEDI